MVSAWVLMCALTWQSSALQFQFADRINQSISTAKLASHYTEGEILNADWKFPGWKEYNSEYEVQVACDADPTCLGYWQGYGGPSGFVMLKSGSRTWKKGVPNDTVLSVKVKVASDYTEGEILNADWKFSGWKEYNSEYEVQVACDADPTCLGYWQGYGGPSGFVMLKSGGRTWKKGVPNDSVLSVKMKAPTCAPPTPSPTPACEDCTGRTEASAEGDNINVKGQSQLGKSFCYRRNDEVITASTVSGVNVCAQYWAEEVGSTDRYPCVFVPNGSKDGSNRCQMGAETGMNKCCPGTAIK